MEHYFYYTTLPKCLGYARMIHTYNCSVLITRSGIFVTLGPSNTNTQIMIYYDYYENIPTIYGVDPTPCAASLPTGTMNIVIFKILGFRGILVLQSQLVR